MANSYIQIKDAESNTYKKISVLWTDYSDGTVSQMAAERAANGTLLVSIGKTYRMWRGVFKIDATPKTGYAGRSDIERWCTSDVPARRQLTMIDNYGSTHTVFIPTPVEFKYGSPVPDGVSSFFLVPFEMQTRDSVSV